LAMALIMPSKAVTCLILVSSKPPTDVFQLARTGVLFFAK
jgi:hypothetical protein